MKVMLLVLLLVAVGCRSFNDIGRRSVATPVVLARADWNAKSPASAMKRHTPTRITIHHTATRQKPERSLADKLRALQEFSQKEGRLGSGTVKPPWPDVPYHYYVDCAGAIGEGRPVEFVGDTNTEYDPTGHVLVVLEGNFEQEAMTQAQLDSLLQVTIWLAQRWSISPDGIKGHKDFAATACPGRRLQAHLPRLRQQVADALIPGAGKPTVP